MKRFIPTLCLALLCGRTAFAQAAASCDCDQPIAFKTPGPVLAQIPVIADPPIYRDPGLPMEKRVDDLIRRMTIEEKAGQMMDHSQGIPRLGLPAYGYWNECLHGVARNGRATVFPQAIGLAAMWDTNLIHQIADTIATEARAKYAAIGYDQPHDRYQGLTFWTPNINIFRDPRWGRGQETYGEDPFLTAETAVAFIRGLQGDDPHYLKAAACAKHFAVHSGPESGRRSFNAQVSERDLYETYLPQFEAAVRRGKVATVMAAYNGINGVPCCANRFTLQDLLRNQWGFTGQVVSDCGAVGFIYTDHGFAPTFEGAAADAVNAGVDLECGDTFTHLPEAVSRGLTTETQIDLALRRVLEVRFRLGLFDPPNRVPYARISANEFDTPEHGALALKAARESIVLLKNDGLLPLDKTRLHTVAVIGANADSVPMLLGNYNGEPSMPVTIFQGIKAALGNRVAVALLPGCPLALTPGLVYTEFNREMDLARHSDVVIYVGGISPGLEGEEMNVDFDGFKGGDRTRIELPAVQTALLKALHATGKPVVFVNCSGSAVAMPWEAGNLPAILQAWYPGQAGGTAVADVLFGDCNPSGRLPITIYRSTQDLPPFEDYRMANRTYRYFSGQPLFAFGHGLSYTRFEYGDLQVSPATTGPNGIFTVSVNVRNAGAREGDEVVQVYAGRTGGRWREIRRLVGFQRVSVRSGATAAVQVNIPVEQLRIRDPGSRTYVVEPGGYTIEVGASSADIRCRTGMAVAAR
jgi:beta-glucosidase